MLMEQRKSLGVCFGSSTVSLVELSQQGNHIVVESVLRREHKGNPKKVIGDILSFSKLNGYHGVVVTGRKFTQMLNLEVVSEPEAIEEAMEYLRLSKEYDTVVSLGGETSFVYFLGHGGKISKVETGNKCASGTGEFFLQQLSRMNLNVDEAMQSASGEEPHQISGRCSVFCKSDCTHALNIGIPSASVVAGLSKMMADKIVELLTKGTPEKIVVIGGVSQNKSVLRFLSEKFPNIHVPKEATYFEALGAGLIALKKENSPKFTSGRDVFKAGKSSFTFHPALRNFVERVHFKEISYGIPSDQDNCILGLDVGSTTTKAILLRIADNAILASVYLRTNGQPVKASIACYRELQKKIKVNLNIIGLGVTGSGRQIAGLHALTDGIVNEIIAHAEAAVYFDKGVETIFEIGGQDAKYTFITNKVATDYAMNEACSAGTGSFLEEAAKETLSVDFIEIGDIALQADQPPDFNDQCAAFISSDIKNALQEGLRKEDVVAGLVYSVCQNYVNRVKGSRAVGRKIFLQGGVCYNKAVPVAMASLTGTDIIVPPEPGLMGAFGVALVIKQRIESGQLERKHYELQELIDRPFAYGKAFVCPGGQEKCDLKCQINVIKIAGELYPFGGACNKYYNSRTHLKTDAVKNNLVKVRQDLVFKKYAKVLPMRRHTKRMSVGISKSFLVNTLYPLYYHFFAGLGLRVVLSDQVSRAGRNRTAAPFCYPVEIAHGLFQDLIDKKVDIIFMPHITEVHNANEEFYKKTCVFVQGEPYYLKNCFKDEKLPRIISPVINFSRGYHAAIKDFEQIAVSLGKSAVAGRRSFRKASKKLEMMLKEFKQIGRQTLEALDKNDECAIVLFGRPYNAFAGEANLNIPHKFASRAVTVIPHDFLPAERYPSYHHMYWGLGQQIIKGARLVKNHPNLFGAYITNFSCGPDSFLLSYFREIMGSKPSLTLELDSHSADAGINTRIDAALDIFRSSQLLSRKNQLRKESAPKTKLLELVSQRGKILLQNEKGQRYNLFSKEVEVLIPSMGEMSTSAMTAVMRAQGINAKAIPVSTMETLKTGRKISNCKECLPFILTTGSAIEYLQKRKDNKMTLIFMPKGAGPCRQGQYHVRLKEIIAARHFENVGVLSLDDENSYGGLGVRFIIKSWKAVICSDIFEDSKNALFTLAVDRNSALKIFDAEWKKILHVLAGSSEHGFYAQLRSAAATLSKIELKIPLAQAKVVSLIGEVFVRREQFSRLDLIEHLAEKGFVVRIAPLSEYVYYCNYLAKRRHRGVRIPWTERLKVQVSDQIQQHIEKKIIKIMIKSKLIYEEPVDVAKIIGHSTHLIKDDLLGETILTVGSALKEIIDHCCGVISIGPFACMPSRFAESILNAEMNIEGKATSNKNFEKEPYRNFTDLPFLSIETDGNMFPLIIQSKIDIFMLQAERLHRAIKKTRV